AELGFLGVMILTWRHTPRFCGQLCSAGCFGLRYCWRRGLRTSWLIVGIHCSPVGIDKRRLHRTRVSKPLPYDGRPDWSRGKAGGLEVFHPPPGPDTLPGGGGSILNSERPGGVVGQVCNLPERGRLQTCPTTLAAGPYM